MFEIGWIEASCILSVLTDRPFQFCECRSEILNLCLSDNWFFLDWISFVDLQGVKVVRVVIADCESITNTMWLQFRSSNNKARKIAEWIWTDYKLHMETLKNVLFLRITKLFLKIPGKPKNGLRSDGANIGKGCGSGWREMERKSRNTRGSWLLIRIQKKLKCKKCVLKIIEYYEN